MGNVQIISLLLQETLSSEIIDIADENGYTPLAIAVINKQYEAALKLIERGANPLCLTKTGQTIFHLIAQSLPPSENEMDTAIKLLVLLSSHQLDFDAKNNDGKTAAQLAFEFGNLPLAKFFAKTGVCLDGCNEQMVAVISKEIQLEEEEAEKKEKEE